MLLELSREEGHTLALLLIGAEGDAQRQEAQYRDWALSLPTEAQRETAQKLAEEARGEYLEAMKGVPTKPLGFVGRGRTNGVEWMPGNAGWSGTEFVLTTDKLYRAAARAETKGEESS